MNTEIRQLIMQSFLPQARKGELLSLLVERGGDEEFFRIFNEYLAKDIKAKSAQHQITMQGIDDGMARIDAQHVSQEEQAMKVLESTLSTITADDIAGKKDAWDRYYAVIEQSERVYDQSLRQLGAEMLMAH